MISSNRLEEILAEINGAESPSHLRNKAFRKVVADQVLDDISDLINRYEGGMITSEQFNMEFEYMIKLLQTSMKLTVDPIDEE